MDLLGFGLILGFKVRQWTNLKHCDKEHVISGNHFIDELDKLLHEALIFLEPGGVEVEAQGCPVSFKVSVEVVPEHASKLLWGEDVRASGDKMTSGQTFIKIWIVSSVQLVDDHFPDRVASGWASLGISVALVWHAVVQGVWPDWNAAKWGSDGCVVDKELISHHFELLVASNPEVRSTDSND